MRDDVACSTTDLLDSKETGEVFVSFYHHAVVERPSMCAVLTQKLELLRAFGSTLQPESGEVEG
jgi:hypothetical protein